MSHIAGDICARSRTCSGVSVIERLPFLWRFFAFLACVYSLTLSAPVSSGAPNRPRAEALATLPLASMIDGPVPYRPRDRGGPLDRVAQIADRKHCRPHARPFRLGFPRKVPVFPICPPAAL